jgi:hypothetical protein
MTVLATAACGQAAAVGLAGPVPAPGFNAEVTWVLVGGAVKNPAFRIFDRTGRTVHHWSDPLPGWAFGELVKPLSRGRILAILYDRNSSNPRHKILAELDWQGAVLWQFDPTSLGLKVHHDFERLPNGNTIFLGDRPIFDSRIHPTSPILDDVLVEVDPAGAVVWSWSMAQNWSQLPLDPDQRAYLRSFPGPSPKPVFHTNSVQSLPPNALEQTDPRFARGNLLVTLRETNLLILIERGSGTIVWSHKGPVGPHHGRMIPFGLPGAGNILLFDNGGKAGAPPVTRSYSRVVELDPVTKREVWVFECPPPGLCATPLHRSGRDRSAAPRGFFTPLMGNAQRLANGHTLIDEAESARVFEVDVAGAIVWEHVNPNPTVAYRYYRFPLAWPEREISFTW